MKPDLRHELRLLPYAERLVPRDPADVDLVVIHCTELPDLQTARRYAEEVRYAESGTGNSGHVYIDRDGTSETWVGLDRTAHHTRGYNERSIGIELVNLGRFPDWYHSANQAMSEPYPDSQIEALIALLRDLEEALPSLALIAGHEDLDRDRVPAADDPTARVARKLDPGPRFPWARVLDGVGLQRVFANGGCAA